MKKHVWSFRDLSREQNRCKVVICLITEQDLREAIAECQGTRNPNANTCIKLAAYYTILNNLNENQVNKEIPAPIYSFASDYDISYSDSQFSQMAMDKGIKKVFPIIDEAMDALSVLNPKLYNSILRKISDL